MTGGDNDARIIQVRTEGKIDRLSDKVERFQADVVDLRDRHHSLSNRVGVLEADKHLREGERKGFITTGRLAWGAVTIGLSGGTMALVKLLLL